MHILVTGAGSERTVTIALRSVDGAGIAFVARATFRSSAAGEVDAATARATGGEYQGVDPMGLIDAMRPASGASAPYNWSGGSHRFEVTVSEGGSRIASGEFVRRWLAPGVAVRSESITATGFYGQYWTPPVGGPSRPAVLEFGGSEGGLHGQLIGAALAAAGYPTLDIAYFGEAGLPRTLTEIPLEYFARALRWLAGQPHVRHDSIYVLGASRGSEAALLLGVHYPDVVHGVIASSPSDLSFASYPTGKAAAWTFQGRPVPYSTARVDLGPVNDPAAEIPVQRIRGPIFLDCGTEDQIWSSCAYALRMVRRLKADRFPYPDVLYRYQGAGHHVNTLVPYQPGEGFADLTEPLAEGNTLFANADAHARLWPRLLSFLAHPAGQAGVITAPSTAPPLTSP
ncbi:MAG: acyl-CoA thioesterase/BAAT N-terminal domain-containing protein [Solirubrobacterales bacterium]|nr:acyl-CoA thioesterase/BAAT N-terminal domain-containing protein [Solirubrobacterales bacterium]